MRVLRFRFVLPLLVVLLGAMLMLGGILQDDADGMVLPGHAQSLRLNESAEATASIYSPLFAHRQTSAVREVRQSGMAVLDLVCVIRC